MLLLLLLALLSFFGFVCSVLWDGWKITNHTMDTLYISEGRWVTGSLRGQPLLLQGDDRGLSRRGHPVHLDRVDVVIRVYIISSRRGHHDFGLMMTKKKE